MRTVKIDFFTAGTLHTVNRLSKATMKFEEKIEKKSLDLDRE